VLDLLAAGPRQRIRRSGRAFGALETEWARSAEHGLDILEELIMLHQQRWSAAGERGAFASRRFADFHRELVARGVPEGRALLFRIRASGRTVGCLYGLLERQRVLFYQSGFSSVSDNRLKPGLTAHAVCMQACYEAGFHEYDYLAGDSRYKRELSTGERELTWAAERGRRRPALVLYDLLRRASRRGEGW
jgi:CelD/BcsL family acetyltransferase involved in cellulose biosynthesis